MTFSLAELSTSDVKTLTAACLILLLPPILAFSLFLLDRALPEHDRPLHWIAHLKFLRLVNFLVVPIWWAMFDSWIQRGLTREGSVEWQIFWFPPLISALCYRIVVQFANRQLLTQRWSMPAMASQTVYGVASRDLPLLMLARGFSELAEGTVWGLIWMIGAGMITVLATVQLREAEGLSFRRVKSGEIYKRALELAKRSSIKLERVYVVPAGRGHLVNAYGMRRSIAVTDSYGKYLSEAELDAVIGHELGHIKYGHGRKNLLFTLVAFAIAATVFCGLSALMPISRPWADAVALLAPLLVHFQFGRRLEFEADRTALDVTRSPESTIRALAKIHDAAGMPHRINKLVELFQVHPSLENRISALTAAANEFALRRAVPAEGSRPGG